MERNREGRRGMGAMNGGGGGGGMSRRRQRNGSYRDSPEDDGGMEMQETGRLRDRGSKKERDRDRSGRSKRRRGDRTMLANNREEGEESSEDTDEEEDEDDEEASVAVRLPPPPPPPMVNHAPPLNSMSQNHHRKSFPMTAKTARPPAVWKPADEMIGVSVPRKARTSSIKRSQEVSSSCGGSEPIHRQASTSPARPSPSSASQISPSSSSAPPAKKKMKPISGTKHRPLKISKSSSVSEDMEMVEVAEVLFELTRQFQPPETSKFNSKDASGSSNEIKQKVSSPISGSLPPAGSHPPVSAPLNPSSSTTQMSSMAPKMKRPRIVKSEEETAANPASLPALPSTNVSSAAKTESEHPAKAETSSPRSEKNTRYPMVENGGGHKSSAVPQVAMIPMPIGIQQESVEPENNSTPDLKVDSDRRDQTETKQGANPLAKEIPPSDLDVNVNERSETETVPTTAENVPKANFSIIDLMVPPPGKSLLEMEGLSDYVSTDHKAEDTKIQLGTKCVIANGEVGKMEKSTKREAEEAASEAKKTGNSTPINYDLKKHINKERKHNAEERKLDLQLDFDKHDKNGLQGSKQQAWKEPTKAAKMEHGADNAEQPAPLPFPTTIAGWPGSFPPLGYMGQVPPLQTVVPVEGTAGSSKSVQRPNFLSAQLRPKRCATHCYIAHNIHYHQQLSRMNSFWPAAAGAPQLYGAKPCDPNVAKHYNLNAVPPLETSILGNSLQGNIAARNLGSVQEKAGQLAAGYMTHMTKEKPQAGNSFTEATQRKQLVLQQVPQSGSAANLLHGPPAFIFPINQQQATAAPARSGTSKPAPGTSNAVASSSSASSVVGSSGASGPATTMTFNYPVMPPNEAQYIAMLQNSGYPFPIPAVGAPPTYRGGIAAQPVPFFNGHFYSSQMLHPQLQQQQQQQASTYQPPSQQPSHSQAQQGHQNTSTSSGSSSSHKPQQQSQRAAGGGPTGNPGSSIQGFLASKQHRHHLPTHCEMGTDDNPSTADSKVPQAQKNLYGHHNLAMAIHPQNFALISPAAAAALGSGGVNHNEKQQPPPQQQQPIKMDLTTSQAFAMSFASSADGGAALPQGLDFSSMAQNHAIFQGFPDAAKHGYHISVAAAAAAAVAQASQHRKLHHQNAEDGKLIGDSMNTSTAEEDRKMMATSKPMGNVPQNSINFSRSDNDAPRSTVVGNSVIESSSRTLNLIQAPSSNGGRLSNRPASAAPATSGSATASVPSSSQLQQQQQQQLIQLQKLHHQHQQLQLQNQFGSRNTKSSMPTTNTTMYSDRLPAGSTISKFPQALAGFPQAFMQGTGAVQSPQWKASTRASTPAPTATPAPSSSKNQLSQLQGRTLQQPIVMPGHQTQISFGVSSSKAAAPAGQQQHLSVGGSSNPSVPSAAVGSPKSSVSKSAGGSPRASSGAKPSATQQQQPAKNSPSSSSNLKSSPLSNSSTPSILGHSPVTKQQQQQPLPQQLQKQPFSQAQFFFSNAYLQAQPSQSNGPLATAGYYHQRRRSEDSEQSSQQHAQPSSTLGSTRMLSLCPTTMALTTAQPTTTDPAKGTDVAAAAASNMKSVQGMLQHPAQFASHPFMTAAAAAAFPYIQTMPPAPVKPGGEQKPAAGNDNLHVSWHPEKR